MDWDELHIIREDAVRFIREAVQKKPTKKTVDVFCDYLEYVLCLIYGYGWKDAEEILGIVPMDEDKPGKAVNKEIAGETFRGRVAEQVDLLSVDGLLRIIDTESHRDYNEGVQDAGETSGIPNIKKRWNTMMDEKVRDAHQWLEGMEVGLDDLFYTDDCDSAYAPGGFSLPENNVNCRCWITLAV